MMTNQVPSYRSRKLAEFSRSSQSTRSLAIYQVVFILFDFISNLVVDSTATDPLIILVFFVFQILSLIVNLMFYVMGSASQAMQTGLRKSTIQQHEINILSLVTYFVLTCSWYVWTLRRAWPSVSDQFSFTFTTRTNESAIGSSSRDEADDGFREYYTLWSPGFIALYTIQRTAAALYYVFFLKATFLLLTRSSESRMDEDWDEDHPPNSYLSTISALVDHQQIQDHPQIHLNESGFRSGSKMEIYKSPPSVHQSNQERHEFLSADFKKRLSNDSPSVHSVQILKSRRSRHNMDPSSSSETENSQ